MDVEAVGHTLAMKGYLVEVIYVWNELRQISQRAYQMIKMCLENK